MPGGQATKSMLHLSRNDVLPEWEHEERFICSIKQRPNHSAAFAHLTQVAAAGLSNCTGNGWLVAQGTTSPYCDCKFGWSGKQCSVRTDQRQPTAAFSYLAYGTAFAYELQDALESLDKSFGERMGYDVLIFHSRLPPELLSEMRSWSRRRVRLQEVRLDYPLFARKDPRDWRSTGARAGVRAGRIAVATSITGTWVASAGTRSSGFQSSASTTTS
jgi:hypothetical protein